MSRRLDLSRSGRHSDGCGSRSSRSRDRRRRRGQAPASSTRGHTATGSQSLLPELARIAKRDRGCSSSSSASPRAACSSAHQTTPVRREDARRLRAGFCARLGRSGRRVPIPGGRRGLSGRTAPASLGERPVQPGAGARLVPGSREPMTTTQTADLGGARGALAVVLGQVTLAQADLPA